MTQERAASPEPTLGRLMSIARRARAATPGPWGYLRPSGVICGPDASDVALCLNDPDAVFIARSDIPWLLDGLQAAKTARRVVQAHLQGHLDWLGLGAAIRQANEELNRLPWQGDGLHSFVAEGLDRDQARWICQVMEAVATALDRKSLGLKDGDR
jgi:hypothetical protein